MAGKSSGKRQNEVAKENQAARKQKQDEAKAKKEQAKADAAALREQERAQREAEDEAIKDGDTVEIDGESVPEALRTGPLTEQLKGLSDGGFNGKVGRVVGQQESPAGVQFIVEGRDFSKAVPAAALKKSSGVKKSAEKKAAKSATKKAARGSKKK